MWIYILGPLTGGILAGLWAKFHEYVHRKTNALIATKEKIENINESEVLVNWYI